VGDLTTHGSAKLGYLLDAVKSAFAVPYYIGQSFCTFIKTPDRDVLREVFENLMNPSDVVFYYFSDDSCIGINCSDGIFTANLDISACDGSNYDTVFRILWQIMRVDERYNKDVDGAFYQCAAPFSVRSMVGTVYRCVTFIPRFFTLYSGSVLTTSINNLANSLIFMSVKRSLPPVSQRKRADMVNLLVECAANVGYLVKIDVCHHHSDLQFLKHSPAIVNGRVVPWLNIATMLRGFGSYRGDLPCVVGRRKLSLLERSRIFNSDVVKSFVHVGEHAVHTALKTHIVEETYGREFEQTQKKSFGGSMEYIPDEEICRRYKISESQYHEMCHLLKEMRFGQVVACDGFRHVFAKDYGYSA
jgi:hypothetical protein